MAELTVWMPKIIQMLELNFTLCSQIIFCWDALDLSFQVKLILNAIHGFSFPNKNKINKFKKIKKLLNDNWFVYYSMIKIYLKSI